MDKPATILVIGDAEQAESAIRAFQRQRCGLACCAGDNHFDIRDQSQGTRLDWVMIDTGILNGDERELIQSLRAMGFFSSPPEPAGQGRCGVEWAHDGTLQLRCCMHLPGPPVEPGANSGIVRPQSGFVFEYHAPVKRTG